MSDRMNDARLETSILKPHAVWLLSLAVAFGLGSCRDQQEAAPDPDTTPPSAAEATAEQEQEGESGGSEQQGQVSQQQAQGSQQQTQVSESEDGQLESGLDADQAGDTGGEDDGGKINGAGDDSSQGDGNDGKINADRSVTEDEQETETSAGADCKDASSVTQTQIDQWISADQQNRGGSQNIRYAYVSPELLGNQTEANLARVGMFKALNHTAINAQDIYVGEDVSEGHCAAYAIDVTQLWPNRGTNAWQILATGQGARNTGSPGAPSSTTQNFQPNEPAPARAVAANAVATPRYLTLIEAPGSEAALRRKIGANTAPIAYSAVNEGPPHNSDAIVFGSRVIYVRETNDGKKYWISCDRFIGAQEGQRMPYGTNELPRITNSQFGHRCGKIGNVQAHEAWHEMDNGFPAWYVWGNGAQLRGRAEKEFVVDPNYDAGRNYLVTGRSCITCHKQGVQQIQNDYAGEGQWTSQAQMDQLYSESRQKFVNAMTKITERVATGESEEIQRLSQGTSSKEPINFLLQKIEGGGGNARGNGGGAFGGGRGGVGGGGAGGW